MKKKFYSIFALILSIVLSLSLLSGCGGEDDSGDQSDTGDTGDAVTMEIAGDAWEADGTVYHFFEDGVAYVDTGWRRTAPSTTSSRTAWRMSTPALFSPIPGTAATARSPTGSSPWR